MFILLLDIIFSLSDNLLVLTSSFFFDSDFLNDFFKPISNDMDRLKSFKKHKHGRRIKQLEKFELKMKEERQKRIRERQKDFFGEIEVHKYVFFSLYTLAALVSHVTFYFCGADCLITLP